MTQVDQMIIDARITEILNRWPTIGLAVGVVRDGRLEYFHGHGFADIAARTPITEDTVFRIGSITKTFTAIAVMQLWEQGLVDLDAPANDYLRAYQLMPAKPRFRSATARDLLTHTAGIPQAVHPTRMARSGWFGESFEMERPLPDLAEYYGGALRLVAEPGTTFTYGDHNFATLGQMVEDVSGKPLAHYLREHIFEPLGMTDTDLLRSERVRSRLATGYKLRADGAAAVTDRNWVAQAASSIYSTPRDMARYLAALLGGGANEHGSVLQPTTLATMYEPHYRTDSRMPGFGLGFFRAEYGSHHTVEHQGVLPGFHSQIHLAPADGVGIVAFTNGAARPAMWLASEMSELLRRLIGAPEEVIRTDVPHHPEIWDRLCGWYRPRAQRTDMQALAMVGVGIEVFVRGGRLMLRILNPIPALYKGLPLHPDDTVDPYVFRIDLSELGIGTSRIAFRREAGGGMSIHLDAIPLSLHKEPTRKNPRLWVNGTVAATATAVAARRFRRARRRRRRTPIEG